VTLDGDSNAGGGSEAGFDGSGTYDLSAALASFTPHPIQGFHVKLRVDVPDPGNPHAAYKKFKVFWVKCEEPPTTTTTTTTTTTEQPTTTEAPTTTAEVLDSSTLKPAEVLGEEITRSSQLPRTGIDAGLLAMIGLALIALGGVIFATGRQVEASRAT